MRLVRERNYSILKKRLLVLIKLYLSLQVPHLGCAFLLLIGGTHSFPILGQVRFQRLDVLVKAKRAHGPEQVIAIDGLALFL